MQFYQERSFYSQLQRCKFDNPHASAGLLPLAQAASTPGAYKHSDIKLLKMVTVNNPFISKPRPFPLVLAIIGLRLYHTRKMRRHLLLDEARDVIQALIWCCLFAGDCIAILGV